MLYNKGLKDHIKWQERQTYGNVGIPIPKVALQLGETIACQGTQKKSPWFAD